MSGHPGVLERMKRRRNREIGSILCPILSIIRYPESEKRKRGRDSFTDYSPAFSSGDGVLLMSAPMSVSGIKGPAVSLISGQSNLF